MRVCFGTLCFSSWLNAAVDEEAPQVVTVYPGNSRIGNGLTMAEAFGNHSRDDLIRMLMDRTEAIINLKSTLAERDRELAELRSQLDKFQSVFAVTHPASPKGLGGQLRPRKQRAGISAEPQNEKTILELCSTTFPTIYKKER
ncbi:hypothetical protein GWI33_010584 [Rhynchophorus ferrugineus]|uniref:Uncharacterized protein n=1 Tax=Rhynchophorus ferrugineus TaxID=354439 RepID=A0A834ISX4_RHYFE|nr:hypothetical protein GWI33_010584 [Rhynchophorus ferrugineus]